MSSGIAFGKQKLVATFNFNKPSLILQFFQNWPYAWPQKQIQKSMYVVVEPLSSEQNIYKGLLFYQKNKENLIVK